MTVIRTDTTHVVTSTNLGISDIISQAQAELAEVKDNIKYINWTGVSTDYPTTTELPE